MQQNKKVSWEDLYFLAEASKEDYRDVYLITAKSAYVGLIEGKLIDQVLHENTKLNPTDPAWQSWIKDAVSSNAFDKRIYVHEYVEVQPTHITVCLNRDVVDEQFIEDALDQLSSVLDTLNGEYGKVILSKKLFFSVKNIPWLNTH